MADLSRFPAFVPPRGESLWRAHRADGPVLRFSTAGSGRFDPPSERRGAYGTCYMSTTPEDAFLDRFGRFGPVLSSGLVRPTAVTEVAVTRPLRLADLTVASAVTDYFDGYDPFQRGDYELSQRYGSVFLDHGFDGVRYRAEHRTGYESMVFAVFGEPGEVPAGEQRSGLDPLKETLLDDLLLALQESHDTYVVEVDDDLGPDADRGE
jgi:RES domain